MPEGPQLSDLADQCIARPRPLPSTLPNPPKCQRHCRHNSGQFPIRRLQSHFPQHQNISGRHQRSRSQHNPERSIHSLSDRIKRQSTEVLKFVILRASTKTPEGPQPQESATQLATADTPLSRYPSPKSPPQPTALPPAFPSILPSSARKNTSPYSPPTDSPF